jgi:hypothetical protein
MKWIISTLLWMMWWMVNVPLDLQASYEQFESFNLISGKTLADYSKEDYEKYHPYVMRPKWMGYRVMTVHSRLKASYVKETLFSYYNDGFTAIDYTFKSTYTMSKTIQVSVTGSLSYGGTQTEKAFKKGLDSALKITSDYKQSESETRVIEVKIKVDPQTQVDLYVYGEGYLTNGVAAEYVFFFRKHLGGFEYFEVTTEYQRLEKYRI